jgi:hypothetical protein
VGTAVPTRLNAAAGRRFGLTVGTAFGVLTVLTWWRDHLMISTVFGGLALLLILGGLVIPTRLGPVERAWMALAHAISKVTTPIVMGIVYLGVIVPVGFLRRRLSGNPLVHSEVASSYWRSRPEGRRRSGDMKRQF